MLCSSARSVTACPPRSLHRRPERSSRCVIRVLHVASTTAEPMGRPWSFASASPMRWRWLRKSPSTCATPPRCTRCPELPVCPRADVSRARNAAPPDAPRAPSPAGPARSSTASCGPTPPAPPVCVEWRPDIVPEDPLPRLPRASPTLLTTCHGTAYTLTVRDGSLSMNLWEFGHLCHIADVSSRSTPCTERAAGRPTSPADWASPHPPSAPPRPGPRPRAASARRPGTATARVPGGVDRFGPAPLLRRADLAGKLFVRLRPRTTAPPPGPSRASARHGNSES